MERVLTVHLPGAEPARRVLPGPISAGGSRADGLLLPGAPPAALRLVPAAAGVVVEPGAAGVRVAGHSIPAGARRLLRAGDRLEVGGASIVLGPPWGGDGTRAAASPLLRGDVAGDGPAVVVLTGPRAGERHAIRAELTVGRGRAAGLRVPDPLASRIHVRLRARAGTVVAEDLGSKNGVRVNGVKLDRRPSPLRPGDELALGDTLLALEDPFAAEGPPTAGAPGGAPAPRRARARGPLAAAVAALLLAASATALALAAP